MELQLLVENLEPVQDDWKSLGHYLKVKLDVINEIEVESSNEKLCQEKVLKYWLIQNPSGSWDDVITALNKLGRTELAKKLGNKYATEGL